MERRGGRQGRGRPQATQAYELTPLRTDCPACGQPMWVAYHEQRTVERLDGRWWLTLRVRRCRNAACARGWVVARPDVGTTTCRTPPACSGTACPTTWKPRSAVTSGDQVRWTPTDRPMLRHRRRPLVALDRAGA
jgi:ribosomal protein S27AE